MQKLVLLQTITFETIKAKLRNVNLRENQDKHPYREANILLAEFDPSDLKPAAFYVLEEQIKTHQKLRNIFLKQYALDTLKLRCGLVYKDTNRVYTMYPPIIEESIYDDSQLIILDGLHRIFLARELGINIVSIFISEVSPECPFPCLPLEWKQVVLAQEVPSIKRLPRQPDAYYSLHRDFTILNLGGSRKIGAKN